MGIKQRAIYVCDQCGKEIKDIKNIVEIEDFPYEGASTISYRGMCLEMKNLEFCCLDCLCNYIKDSFDELE